MARLSWLFSFRPVALRPRLSTDLPFRSIYFRSIIKNIDVNVNKITALKSAYQDLRFLAKTTGSSTSISVTYILFLTKMQKGKPPIKDLPILKNDITTIDPVVFSVPESVGLI